MKGKKSNFYRGTLLAVKNETEKALLATIKWGNGVTESWMPKKAYRMDCEPRKGASIRVFAWFVEKTLVDKRIA